MPIYLYIMYRLACCFFTFANETITSETFSATTLKASNTISTQRISMTRIVNDAFVQIWYEKEIITTLKIGMDKIQTTHVHENSNTAYKCVKFIYIL